MSCLARLIRRPNPSSRSNQDSGRDSTVVTVTGDGSSAASTLTGKRDVIYANQIYISHGTSLIEYLKQQKDEVQEIVKGQERTIRDLRDRVARLETMLRDNTNTSNEILEDLKELNADIQALPEDMDKAALLDKVDVIISKTRSLRKPIYDSD